MEPAELAALDDRSYHRRLLAVVLLGAGAALVLTWFMHGLIHSSRQRLDESKRVHLVDFVRLQREEASVPRDRRPMRPRLHEAPPAPGPPLARAGAGAGAGQVENTLAVSAAVLPDVPDANISIGGPRFEAGDGEYMPIVKIAPVYPYRAQAIGLEGECVVIYTVTATGTTRDIRVIEHMCTDELFHTASVEAAKKFKYKPRVIDGQAVEVHDVTNRFIYRIPDELKR